MWNLCIVNAFVNISLNKLDLTSLLSFEFKIWVLNYKWWSCDFCSNNISSKYHIMYKLNHCYYLNITTLIAPNVKADLHATFMLLVNVSSIGIFISYQLVAVGNNDIDCYIILFLKRCWITNVGSMTFDQTSLVLNTI